MRWHTIDTSLGKLLADPATSVAKVGTARYVTADDGGQLELGPQKEAVQDRVLAVLDAASGPMRPAEVWSVVEAQHREAMSYEAVAGFLSLAAKHPNLPVERARRGWYQLRDTT